MSKEPNGYMEQFRKFIDAVRGRRDIKSKVSVITDPENLDTMSILTQGQVEFCSIAKWIAGVEEWGGIFEGLDGYATSMKAHSISKRGKGREQAIQYVASLSESKILSKLGLTVSGEDKKK